MDVIEVEKLKKATPCGNRASAFQAILTSQVVQAHASCPCALHLQRVGVRLHRPLGPCIEACWSPSLLSEIQASCLYKMHAYDWLAAAGMRATACATRQAGRWALRQPRGRCAEGSRDKASAAAPLRLPVLSGLNSPPGPLVSNRISSPAHSAYTCLQVCLHAHV